MIGAGIVLKSETVPIQTSGDVVLVRQRVRACAVEHRFTIVEQTKIVTAASELARNTLEHGLGGSVDLEVLKDGGRLGIRLRFQDRGPGIANIALALTDGYSSGKGLGLGLGGSKRLVHEFEIESSPSAGATVTVVRWK